MTRADLIPAALILAAGIAGFSLAVHRLPAEMAYAASIGDQRPAVPQVLPDGAIRKDVRPGAIGIFGSRGEDAQRPYGLWKSGTSYMPGQLAIYGQSRSLPMPGSSSLSCGQRSQQGGATRVKPRPRWRKGKYGQE